MAIVATFQSLLAACRTLRDSLQGLELTVIEDRPRADGVLMVERLGNAVEDLRGWLEEGLDAATTASQAVTNPFDGHAACEALTTAHDRFIRLEYRFFFDVVSYQLVHDLTRFGHQRGREWLAWSRGVKQALEQCRLPLRELDVALLAAWQELAERLGTGTISVQTTTIGQQISAPPEVLRSVTGEGMT